MDWFKRFRNNTISPRIQFALKGICTVSLLWLIFQQLDAKAAVEQIFNIDRLYFTLTLLVLFTQSFPAAARWYYVLKIVGYPIKYFTTWLVTMVSSFFNQALPSTLGGDVVRMAHGYQKGIPVKIAVSNVVIDRLSSLASLLLLVAITIPVIIFIIEDKSQWWIAPFFIVIGILGLVLLVSLKHILPLQKTTWIMKTISEFSDHLFAVLFNPRWGWKALVTGLTVHINRVIAVWLIALGMNINASLANCFALVPLTLVVAMIPISIAGWGVREGAFLGAFSLVGVSSGDAVALSVAFGLCVIFTSLPGGLIWLFNNDIRRTVSTDMRTVREKNTQ